MVPHLPSTFAIVALTCATTAFADWPQFRGPNGQGHSDAKGLPIEWSETQNVTWKVQIPGTGHSSPVIAGDQVWMTTAVDKGRSLRAICVDRRTGRLMHNIELFRRGQPGPLHSKNSYATPTPVLDGKHVYIHFASTGTWCLSTSGEVHWKNTALKFRQPYSGASSPILFGELLILTCDGTDMQFMTALNKRTGAVIWKTSRLHLAETRVKADSMKGQRKRYALMAYSTPLVIQVSGVPQLVSPAADHVAAYDARTGREIWWAGYDGFSLVARPVFGHGLIFAVGVENQGTPVLYAIHPDTRGEVTRSQLAWRLTSAVSHVPSPLLIGEELYMVSDKGIATCLDAKTGRIHWKHRIGGNYSASPVFADGRIFVFSEAGKTIVLSPGLKFQQLASNQLAGPFMASPAVAGRAFFLRTGTHLYRIEKKN